MRLRLGAKPGDPNVTDVLETHAIEHIPRTHSTQPGNLNVTDVLLIWARTHARKAIAIYVHQT